MKGLSSRSITFLGDIHGDWSVLDKILKKIKGQIVLIGDVCLGFGYTYGLNKNTGLWEQTSNQDPKKFPKRLKFIRGNHDNPETCKEYPNYMGDYGYKDGIFFVSGARSIPEYIQKSIIGIDWWKDEELSYKELQKVIDLYQKIKPEIVISHTCPSQIINLFMKPPRIEGQRTEKALGEMFKIHQPKIWIFGHWHRKFDKKVLGTRFICLDVNETKTIKF